MNNLTLKVFVNEELLNFYSNSKQHKSDIGFDLYIANDITVLPKQITKIDLGVKAELVYGTDSSTQNYGYFLLPRSSISKTTLMLANSTGVIDPEYRGSIIAAVVNWGDEPVVLTKGERYFQLVFFNYTVPKIEFVKELSKTERNEGGFGSTGK